MVFITTLTSCDMQQQEIQGDKANEEFNGIDSAENGSGNDGNIDDSLLRSPDKDISDEDQSIIYDFSKQNAVYSNDALLYFLIERETDWNVKNGLLYQHKQMII